MKLRNLAGYLLLLIFFVFGSGFSSRNQILFNTIIAGIDQLHLKPQKVDDILSRKLFLMLFKKLDSSQSFFVSDDFQLFRSYELELDDELQDGRTDFLLKLQDFLIQRVKQIEEFTSQLLNIKNLNLEEDDSIDGTNLNKDFYQNIDDLKLFWKRRIKYLILTQYLNLKKEKNESKSEELDQQLLQKAIESTQKTLRRYFENLRKRDRQELISIYINAFIALFDPHSSYLAPRDRENFDIEMRGSLEGIGALLGEEDEYIKVVEIIPGGPAWKSKQLEVGDLILKVAQGDDEPVDIVGMRVFDAVRLIRGRRGSKVKLTVKKSDGRIAVISLIREKIEIRETYARSFIVERRGKKFGYVFLPRFYRDFQSVEGRNAADDLRQILQQISQQKVSGLVLDLRNNGGGALDDAVRLSGLFIPSGPIVQVKDRRAGIMAHYDRDKKVYFAQPLVVLINRYSASASEIVAAALQDYRRAIIVGTGNSFGKGTVQLVLDLDNAIQEKTMQEMKPFGALALTVQIYYRVNGESTQFNGVKPDIVVPDGDRDLEVGERFLENPLEADRIDSMEIERWPRAEIDLKMLRQRSERRVQENVYFRFQDELFRRRNQSGEKNIPLNWKKFFGYLENAERSGEELKKFRQKLKIPFVPLEKTPFKEENDVLLESISSDYFLDEVLNILEDLTSV